MIYKNIVETEEVLTVHFNDPKLQGFDPTAKTLISNMLLFNLNVRLGNLHNGLNDLWESLFFDGKGGLFVTILYFMNLFEFFRNHLRTNSEEEAPCSLHSYI
jgi:hypothetical protein